MFNYDFSEKETNHYYHYHNKLFKGHNLAGSNRLKKTGGEKVIILGSQFYFILTCVIL